MFRDRNDAGKQLSRKLVRYAGKNTVILALPRGGVILGREVADALRAPLDIVVPRKIGHPNNPEYAICAVDEKGTLLYNEEERASVDLSWLNEEIARQRTEAKRRIAVYRGTKEPEEIKGKVAIIVDDGIATGLTMRLAIRRVQLEKPLQVIVAVPVAPADVIRTIEGEADECIVLEPPERFSGSVGAHYVTFEQVEDEEVIQLLHSS